MTRAKYLLSVVVLVSSVLIDATTGQNFTGSQIEGIRLSETRYHRLFAAQGNNRLGRVEVLYNGTWGGICDSNFNYNDARVACRMLQFEDAVCGTSGSFFDIGLSSGTVLMDNIECSGDESALDQCSFDGWDREQGQRCSILATANAMCTYGDIEKYGTPLNITLLESTTTALTIGWSVSENLFSGRDLSGFTDSIFVIRLESEDGTIVTDRKFVYEIPENRQFNETVTRLERDTEYKTQLKLERNHFFCVTGFGDSLETYRQTNYSDAIYFRTNATRKQSNFTVRLVSSEPDVNYLGRLEVLYNNEWGTVCHNRFTSNAANVVCGMLNFTKGALCYSRRSTFGQGQGPIWLEYLNCPESAEIIEDCSHRGWGVHDCDHGEDVGIICRPNEDFPPVEGVRVTNVGPTTVTIEWNAYNLPLNTFRNYYEVRAIHNGTIIQTRSVLGSVTQTTITGLELRKEYNISVRAYFSKIQCSYNFLYGEFSDHVVAVTMERVPSGAPQSFRVDTINTTAIEVQWELPPIGTHGGTILGYKLFYQAANGGDEILIDIQDSETDVFTVGGLEAATFYRFSILVYNSLGNGPRSANLTISTLMFDPMITQFGYYGDGLFKTTSFISRFRAGRVHIFCATEGDTPADWYFSNGTRVGIQDRNFRVGHYPNGTVVLQIADGRPLTYCDGGTYTCVVANETTGHYETRKFTLVINRSPLAPEKPFAQLVQSTSITVGWFESPCDGGHNLSSFSVHVSEELGNLNNIISTYTNVNPSARRFVVDGLRPDTSYSIRIVAVSSDSRVSLPSPELTITTLPPAPAAPDDVTARLVTPTLVEVRWGAPATDYENILHYNVYAIPLESLITQPNSVIRPREVAPTVPNTIHKVFPASARAGNITVVNHSITYEFRVSVSTIFNGMIDDGELSSVTINNTLFIPEPGLPLPVNVRVTQSTNTSVSLAWDYPPPPSLPIQNFLVTYFAEIAWTSPKGILQIIEDSGEVMASDNDIKVSSLVPGTAYQFRIYAVTQSGRGAAVALVQQTQPSQEKLAYFQLRLGPIVDCNAILDYSQQYIVNIRDALSQELEHICPNCDISINNIKEDRINCSGGPTKQAVYRGRMAGTEVYSGPALVALMQSWIAGGRASIMVESFRLHLDPTCATTLDNIKASDCPMGTALPETTTSTAFTPSSGSESVRLGSTVGAGEIVGLVIGGVIILILVVLIVLLALVLLSKYKPTTPKSEHLVVNADFDSKSDQDITGL